MTCFCTCRPGADFDLAADAERVDALIAGGGRGARPERLPAVGLASPLAGGARRPSVRRERRPARAGRRRRDRRRRCTPSAERRRQRRRTAPGRCRAAPAWRPAPATIRSAAPLLSRSAATSVRCRARSAGGSTARDRRPPATCRRARGATAARWLPSPGEHEQVEDRIAVELAGGERDRLAVAAPAAVSSLERAAAQVEEDVDARRPASRNAASGTPSPSRSAQTKPRARADARRTASRGVNVPSPLLRSTTGGAVARRQHEVEVAVGVDVGGPDAVRRRAQHRRRQLRRGVTSVKRPSVVLPQERTARSAPASARSVRKS